MPAFLRRRSSTLSIRAQGHPLPIGRRLWMIAGGSGDLVLGKQGTGGTSTLGDRKSRYTIMMKVERKDAAFIYRKTREHLNKLPVKNIEALRTIN